MTQASSDPSSLALRPQGLGGSAAAPQISLLPPQLFGRKFLHPCYVNKVQGKDADPIRGYQLFRRPGD